MNNDEPDNAPDLNKIAYDVAVETIARMYQDLRRKGLGRMDAAAIVSYILKSDNNEGEDPNGPS